MNITIVLVLIVGVAVISLLIAQQTNKDLRLCLAEKKLLVILVSVSEVCRAAQSESVMDGYPSVIEHPPKSG